MIFEELLELLDPEPHEAALNMAIDEALLRTATAPTLRIYRWARPAVSFGYFGKWADAARAWPAREMVRRWTGGGIVPHGEDVTYSLIVPRAHSFCARSPRESYRAIHECVARAIGHASLATDAAPQISAACFENPVEHDVVVADRKVAGGAQRRSRYGLLHQGSIQFPELVPSSLGRVFASRVSRLPLSADAVAQAVPLAREKYGAADWMKRR